MQSFYSKLIIKSFTSKINKTSVSKLLKDQMCSIDIQKLHDKVSWQESSFRKKSGPQLKSSLSFVDHVMKSYNDIKKSIKVVF